MLKITSTNNQLVKDMRRLDRRRNRWMEKKYIVEGYKMVEEALLNKEPISQIIISEEFKGTSEFERVYDILQDKSLLVEFSSEVFEYVAKTETPQGIMAIMNFNLEELENILIKDKFAVLFLDGLQDPGNLGTIIRTADAFNIDGIVLGEATVDPYNPKVVRATMGSIFRVPIFVCEDNIEFLNNMKERNINILATDLKGKEIDKISLDRGIVVIGNESLGVSSEILELSNDKIKIRMPGSAESLNAGVAASIIMYEIMKSM